MDNSGDMQPTETPGASTPGSATTAALITAAFRIAKLRPAERSRVAVAEPYLGRRRGEGHVEAMLPYN
jgi:hypothetical protein